MKKVTGFLLLAIVLTVMAFSFTQRSIMWSPLSSIEWDEILEIFDDDPFLDNTNNRTDEGIPTSSSPREKGQLNPEGPPWILVVSAELIKLKHNSKGLFFDLDNTYGPSWLGQTTLALNSTYTVEFGPAQLAPRDLIHPSFKYYKDHKNWANASSEIDPVFWHCLLPGMDDYLCQSWMGLPDNCEGEYYFSQECGCNYENDSCCFQGKKPSCPFKTCRP